MLRVVLLLYSIALVGCASNCSDLIFTPVDWPGPELSVSSEILAKAFRCFGNLNATTPNDAGPILLVPGTGVENAASQYSFGWMLELNKLNWPYCLIDPPDYGFGDMHRSGEYIVYAIRTMYELGNRHRVNILGHSQGGMTPRWALRFWPDVRSMVNNMIGFAPANHGLQLTVNCTQGCPPALWQFLMGSQFMCAVNSLRETFDNQISYTQIMTRYDDTIVPISASELSGGTNIYVQDLCANNTVSHVGIGVYDQIAFLITMDALKHNGSASVTRIRQASCQNLSCCNQLYMASFNRTSFDYFSQVFFSNQIFAQNQSVTEEPKLKSYVTRNGAMALLSVKQLHVILLMALILAKGTLVF
jgi:hypothetical protein